MNEIATVMTDHEFEHYQKSPWARPNAKKIVTDRPLNFDKTAHPNATDHWFEPAKEKHGKAWIKGVKRRAGRK